MFVGRHNELSQLEALWDKSVSSLVTCRGRRRVGKSTLIEEFAKRSSEHFIVIEGLSPRKGMSDARQRKNFSERLSEQMGVDLDCAKSWPLAFGQLDNVLPKSGRTVVLLDEISWMGGYEKDFPAYLKTAWDKKLKNHKNLILVLCGSVSTWIADNILNSTGFVGRNSLDLEVSELPLKDAIAVMGPTAERMSVMEKFDILSVVGGIPRYLEEVRPSLTVDENIRRLCFLKQGMLFREFDEMFNDVFGKQAENRRQILEILGKSSMSASEIAQCQGGEVNGHLIRTLKELEYSGFVARESNLNAVTGKPQRIDRYRICDNYVRFYLHFIRPNAVAINGGLFQFASMEQLKGWETLLGYQFENLIINHVGDLFKYLGVDRSLVVSASPYVQRGTKRGEGCQIDLLVQTRRTVYVVEIKRKKFIGPEVMEEMSEKIKRLRVQKGVSVRSALVYEGELSPQIEAEHGFDVLIPASKLI